MAHPVPDWFAADQVVQGKDGWYIGSLGGYRVGPYPRRASAEARSRQLIASLHRCQNTRDRVRTVRRFLHAQTQHHRRQVHTAPSHWKPDEPGATGMPEVRKGENRRVWFRTGRFFSIGGRWYFTTREGIDVGPYPTQAGAEREAQRLLEILRGTETATEARVAIFEFVGRPRGAGNAP